MFNIIHKNRVSNGSQTVTTCIPHGTILGPLIFILYVNELLMLMPDEIIFSYADATFVISTDHSWVDLGE